MDAIHQYRAAQKTAEVERIRELGALTGDQKLTVRQIADQTGWPHSTVHKVLTRLNAGHAYEVTKNGTLRWLGVQAPKREPVVYHPELIVRALKAAEDMQSTRGAAKAMGVPHPTLVTWRREWYAKLKRPVLVDGKLRWLTEREAADHTRRMNNSFAGRIAAIEFEVVKNEQRITAIMARNRELLEERDRLSKQLGGTTDVPTQTDTAPAGP